MSTRFGSLLLTALLLGPTAADAGDCPASVSLPAAWTACEADADCVLAGDACRTCGNYLPVNRKRRQEASALDAKTQAEHKCVRSCEACSPATVRLTCQDKRCVAAPLPPPK